MNTVVDVERRMLLKTAALAGGTCLVTGLPLISYAIAPALRKVPPTWVDLGQADAVAAAGVKMLPYKFLVKDGWVILPRQGLVCAKRGADGKLTVFSSVCPHLGCSVRWAEATATFECPCHSGRFDADGRPIAGPPTKPLVRLEYKVESGKLLVLVSV
jgi:Rieske Fe-S protein